MKFISVVVLFACMVSLKGSAAAQSRRAPNEAGRIPVLMYHSIGDAPLRKGRPRYDRRGLNIAPETFWKQLEMMRAAGWHPVNMRDALTARINVPADKIPVVLTFDDARGSQLRYLRNGAVDPNCAVGILERFNKKYPDWPLRAAFYVLPRSRYNPVPFYQPGKEGQKLQYLFSRGFEVANHSTSHRSMARMDAQTLRWEMAENVRYVKALAPNATMDTMALPYGIAPRDKSLWSELLRGTEGGTAYVNKCILLAAGVPAFPVTHKQYDAKRVMRVGSEPGYVEYWIKNLKPSKQLTPFVSDGNPDVVTVPRSFAKKVAEDRLEGARLVIYQGTGNRE